LPVVCMGVKLGL